MHTLRLHPLRQGGPSARCSIHAVSTIVALCLTAALAVPAVAGAALVSATATTRVPGPAGEAHSQDDAVMAFAFAGLVAPTDADSINVQGSARARVGELGVSAIAERTNAISGPTSTAAATAIAQFSDRFVIHSAGHSGTGFFTASALVEGGLDATIFGRAYADSGIDTLLEFFPGTGFNGGRTVLTQGARRNVGYDIGDTLIGVGGFMLTAMVPFTFDQGVDVTARIGVNSGVDLISGSAGGTAEANYLHTLAWLGMSVVDEFGNPLGDFSALSPTSGFDYRFSAIAPTAVPEPPTALLFGFAGLLLVRRRRDAVQRGARS